MIRAFLAVLALCFAAQMVLAADGGRGEATPLPERYDLVNDLAGLLPIAKRYEIRAKLRALERRNGTQIVLLVVPTTGREGSEAYSLRAIERWNPGNNGEGNGVLFLVSGDDKPWIRTGPGIAGAIPDARVAQIFRAVESLIKQEKYPEAVEAVVDQLIRAASAEETSPTSYAYFVSRLRAEYLWAALLGLVACVYVSVLVWRGRRCKKS
ncbi:TPM domain-containing protein [Niveibacterium terrae]|uniref:TPM domain-containing protein n=1 Tax=Niveibacterium terrae TaxID=3373598 RepID=UPI003A8DD16B